MAGVTIRDIRAICTAPAGINLIVVKVETSEPGLYGLGCATFAYRHRLVAAMVDDYLKPLLVGRAVADISDIWETVNHNAYWRNGPINNNALSGLDMALWDIKGKQAGMPLYDLLGGRCRPAARVYRHANGATLAEVAAKVRQYLTEGVTHVRVQWGGYGGRTGGARQPAGTLPGVYYCPDQYMRQTIELLAAMREELGEEVELLHDVHERLTPIQALGLAKALEPYRLFFLEDLLPPEQVPWFRTIRQQCATPLAMGELFNNPMEWDMLVRERLIDFIRVHISQIGGITPARKLAAFCEASGVRTAWHGPGDVSPVGHAANVHLDLASPNFGIQEWSGLNDTLREVFPGSPELQNGFVTLSERPGLGVDIDEKAAARFPCKDGVTTWTQTRWPDGTAFTP
ncbi:MAG: enolase C-terminal domain-like protein [Lentisphaeria bacterium]|jgi:mannonate dehydratase